MSTKSAPKLQRRKSAQGRLQSSTPAAHASSDGGHETHCQGDRERSDGKGRWRRAKSAREPRTPLERESSAELAKGGGWGSTQYGDDFGHKQPLTPVPVRPFSPTRRNNPHPAKPFLQWKHPVRVHPHKKSVHPPEEAWKYINEGFYDDYTDTYNTGDAKNEVPITNLATIEFPGNKQLKDAPSTPHLMNGVSGTKVQLNSRALVHKSGPGDHTCTLRPPSPKTRMIHNTVKGGTLPVLREWLKTASYKERDIVLQMLSAAHTDSEDNRLQKAVDDVLQPDSASRVQQWLQSATPSERKTLLGVLETLAVASGDSALYPQTAVTWHQPFQHYRSYSYPITLRPRLSCYRHKDSKQNCTHGSSHKGCYSRHSHHHHHHHHTSSHKPHCHKAHKSSSCMKTETHKEVEGEMTLIGKGMGVRCVKTPELWHHKVTPPTEGLRVLHPGSVFLQPHKDRGRHYAIHPEWPTA